jgi:hypothetical protein
MGVVTAGYMSSKVTADDLFKFIMSNIDDEAKNYITLDTYDNAEVGHIVFKFKETQRSLFYCVSKYDNPEYYREYEEKHLLDEDKAYAYISLGCDELAQEIIQKILKNFCGWYDANDCNDEEKVYIKGIESTVSDKSERLVKVKNIVGDYVLANRVIENADELIKLLEYVNENYVVMTPKEYGEEGDWEQVTHMLTLDKCEKYSKENEDMHVFKRLR